MKKIAMRKTKILSMYLGAVFSTMMLFGFSLLNAQNSGNSSCDYQIVLYDSYGDGWNSGEITIYVDDAAVLSNITIQSGYGPESFTFPATNGAEITTTYTPGGWPYENSYEIIDANDSIVFTDGAGSGTPVGIGQGELIANCPAIEYSCDFQIALHDSYGDGWNGGDVTVFVDDVVVLSNITVQSGYGPEYYSFNAANGAEITTSYTPGGWPYENSYQIIDPNDSIVFTDGAGETTPVGIFPGELLANCFGNPHFLTVWTNNPYQPMSIIVNSAAINGLNLQAGDEIGVFDVDDTGNEICVGAIVLEDSITSDNPVIITTSADDGNGNGFTPGNSILYKLWNIEGQTEFSNINADYDPNFDEEFTTFGTALVSLNASGHFQPVWSNNPYQPMSFIISAADVDGQDLGAGNEIGLFYLDDEGNKYCVGAGYLYDPITSENPMVVIASSDDPTTDEIDGFACGSEIHYKFYKADEQIELSNIIPDYNPAFDDEFTCFGTALLSLSGITSFTQIIELNAGWNSMSFFVTPDTINLFDMLQPLVNEGTLIKVIDETGGFIQDIPGVGWMNTIGDMANTEGYYIKVTIDTDISPAGPKVELPIDIPLAAGWNSMGYPIETGQDAMDALETLIVSENLIKVISETGGFIQDIPGVGWMNTIGNLEPGEGYYIKVNATDTLTLDEPVMPMMKAGLIAGSLPTEYFNLVYSGNPFRPMNIVVKDIHGFELEEGDEIAVFDGEVCVGAAMIMDNTSVITIVASEDDPTTEIKDGYTTGNSLSFKLYKNSISTEYQIADAVYTSGDSSFEPLGTWVGELMVDLSDLGELTEPKENFLDQNFPNPAQTQTTINYGLSEGGAVRLEVHSMNGNRVAILVDETQQAGVYSVNLNTSNLEPGLYIYKIQTSSSTDVWTESKTFVVK